MNTPAKTRLTISLFLTVSLCTFAANENPGSAGSERDIDTITHADRAMTPTPAMIGHWAGTAHNDWTKQKTFPVEIDIHPDGTVTGKVGDAILAKAQFKRHRPKNLTRKQSDLMDYMIAGRLTGPIIASESVTASIAFIPLDFTNGKLESSVMHAHGSAVGGKPMGILTADLTLTKKP